MTKREQELTAALESANSEIERLKAEQGYDRQAALQAALGSAEAELVPLRKVEKAARLVVLDAAEYHSKEGWELATKRALALNDALVALDAVRSAGEK